VLVSEVMLQQTQVARVVPRWTAWLSRWPTVEALADAPRAEVIRAWDGLGYNRRAVNLHRAAIEIARHGWPEDLTELPGVGPYTADAVGSLAFGRPVLPVDVNVRRVLERSRLELDYECGPALMSLGAQVCIARVPRCGECPLAPECPSRGLRFDAVRKQPPYEGSFRQQRARTLRLVAARARHRSELDDEAVAALARDGLVEVEGEEVRLPTTLGS
jgi:A/G-specific adenine glycosylase